MKNTNLAKLVTECVEEVHTILYVHETIAEGLSRLREAHAIDRIIYFYVIDEERKLIGVVPTRKLLLSDPKTAISKIMEKEIIHLHIGQTVGDALEIFAKQRLLALPVIGPNGILLGTVDVNLFMEEPFDLTFQQHNKDIFQLLGVTLEDGKKISLWRGYKMRMPWLFCNMLSGIVCAIISRINEDVLAKFLLLAFFIPLVLTLSESVSMQSMTQSLQLLRRPRFSWKHTILKGLWEWKIVGLIALSCGTIIGFISLLWEDGPMPSLIIGLGIMISVTISAIFGILVPVFLHRFKLDPKVASGPVVLMIADVLTTLFYLSLATWWLL